LPQSHRGHREEEKRRGEKRRREEERIERSEYI